MCSFNMKRYLELSAGIPIFSNKMLMWDGQQNIVPFLTVAACRKRAKNHFLDYIVSEWLFILYNIFLSLVHIRKAVIEDCLPDQVRVDHGRKFYLTLFVQQCIADFRTNTQRDTQRQTESKGKANLFISSVNNFFASAATDFAKGDSLVMDKRHLLSFTNAISLVATEP